MKKILLLLLLAIGSADAQTPDPTVYVFDMRAVTIGPEAIDTLDVRMVMGFRNDSVCFNIDRQFCLRIKFIEKTPESTFMLCENEFGEPAGVRIMMPKDRFLVWIMQHPPSVSYFLTTKIP